jgi:uncharacterized membrane protein
VSSVVATPRSTWLRPKTLVFGAVGLMLAYVLYHTEHFLVDPSDPAWPHYRDIGPWLLPHGLVGALALALSFMQFSSRLRASHPLFHRVAGRIYVVGVLITAPFGLYISYLDLKIGYTGSFIAASAVLATLWMLATVIAFGFIRARKIEQHRQWMTRSLAMALVFLEIRVLSGLMGWEDTPAQDTIAVWICVALGYPLADFALQIEQYLARRRVARAS